VRLGEPQTVGTLQIHPLRLDGDAGIAELLLHEALETKALEVIEKQHGDVNELIARNVGKTAVLILEGESVRGQKQNRVITVDILVAPGAEVVVSVGCVESGRWSAGSMKPFAAADMAAEPSIRRSARFGSDPSGKPLQRALWAKVGARLESSDTSSPSQDYLEKMSKFRERVREATQAISCGPDQVGILATEGGKLVGCDLLGHPRTWSRAAERLSQAYVLGSLHADEEFAGAVPVRSAAEWLEAIGRAGVTQAVTQGLGTRFTLEEDSLVGGGLWHEQRPAHVAAFGLERVPKPRS
jgi:hypothetical protein